MEPAALFASLADRIDAVLPQTQCRQCGYDGCRPYADAITRGDADIDQCPPGGVKAIARIASVVGRTPIPLNPVNGAEKPLALAVIDESLCIGCTLCIQACPVDAIVGAAKRMHDVVADLCTGCELCLPPCPVDCIDMVPAAFAWNDDRARDSRLRHKARNLRLQHARASDAKARAASDIPLHKADASADDRARRRKAIIAAAVARAARRRHDASR